MAAGGTQPPPSMRSISGSNSPVGGSSPAARRAEEKTPIEGIAQPPSLEQQPLQLNGDGMGGYGTGKPNDHVTIHSLPSKKPFKFHRKHTQPQGPWEVDFPASDSTYHKKSNYIRTTKYTLLSFFPKTLYYQFRRFYNIYFLVGALSVAVGVSSLSPASQILPLVIVLAFSLAKEAYEDYHRYKADKAANTGLITLLRNGKRVETVRQYVQPGDIVYLKKGDKCPVDAMLLSTSYEDGTCFIETAELDGETNLKRRSAVPQLCGLTTDEVVSRLRGQIQCEQPNDRLTAFEGRVHIRQATGEDITLSLSLTNLMLRGAVLRNTDFAYAIVIYTGSNTKIIKNLKKPKPKSSTLERQLNWLVMGAFVYNAALLISSVWLEWRLYKRAYDREMASKATDPVNYPVNWYLGPVDDNPSRHVLFTIISFFGMYTYVIPISLFVTIEIVRVIQAKYMMWDAEMRVNRVNPDGSITKVKMKANNSNLNEDLGVVEYIFSDKTGTLTMNDMRPSSWYVGGKVLDEMKEPGVIGKALEEPGLDPAVRDVMIKFGLALALCHSVIPSVDPKTNNLIYESQSPDESALLYGVKASGFTLLSRTKDRVNIQCLGEDMSVEQLGLLDFTSDRKRMSVIVRTADGIMLFCKGADNIVIDRLDKNSEWNPRGAIDAAEGALKHFSEEGLRTLVVAYKPLTEEEYETFRVLYDEAETSLEDREQMIAAACETVERDLRFLGCTAIEDRLQPEVPETIEYLLEAGMKVWLLTGDKMETAINIGASSRLISPNMDTIILDGVTDKEISSQIDQAVRNITTRTTPRRYALVIPGATLHHIFLPNSPHPPHLLALTSHCATVICCRVTPLQKALVVQLVQKNLKCVTLAIGDGANDVSMIQAATVGVGVVGREGTQAVRASDYAIGEFRFLARLCGVHGRWSRNRLSGLVFYSFYKNFVFITVQWWFGFLCMWSGQLVYEEIFFTAFNVFFTSLPPLFFAIFDYDAPDKLLLATPPLYKQVKSGLYWSPRHMITTLVSSLIHSLFIFGAVWLAFWDNVLDPSGYSAGYYVQCYLFSAPMLAVVLTKAAMNANVWVGRFGWITGGVLVLSFALNVCVMFVVEWAKFIERGTIEWVHVLPGFWLVGLLIVGGCMLGDWVFKYFFHHFFPSDTDILLEETKKGGTLSWFHRWRGNRNADHGVDKVEMGEAGGG
ncbi:phospholipid-translocating P-type ATPase, flippase, variant 2 [Spizellomyces punctatus DAOM BR117]|uniref:Phospholipid-transporting ATPase n=1 Tax=Spizellomyces punctatus (strain DAOM BR117) TaxID=645134 RepID=A0A0L0H5J5_SPIPD|nr:phospholipid-translocating P-type ATPase, flippase, variant 2 [Spizellomyces punctatus DAOM BR117]KNC96780.1 phospholipid-translocating P-type ATPase, flippase, variant 2 [Spizellomyces punctatus DAOM BR117]|eukprot:XP_016604820.1 phospholipid-translocating P-type ATPase, flippase, variant 2 [Spizellomyces punctatus DAOM BR117]